MGSYPSDTEYSGDGGDGAAGAVADGDNGTEDTLDWSGGNSGGGGGAAGRIRLNTKDSLVNNQGVVSPDEDSGLFTRGQVAVR